MIDLFKKNIPVVRGLQYVPNFIDREEESQLIDNINSELWSSELKRRVQHYGYKYDYRSRSISKSDFIGKLPEWSQFLCKKIHSITGEFPDQLIVNEYEPGQGIANHIDCEPCFTDIITSVSLGSKCVMDLINGKDKVQLPLNTRSLLILQGDARYKWTHGIPRRKSDVINGIKYNRDLRISLTFRKVLL